MKGFEAIRTINGHDLTVPQRIDSVVIVGSTCAGKTTLVDAVRDSLLVRQGRVAVPGRYITRPRRANDSNVENIHVSVAEFESKVADGRIALRWVRQMESGRNVHYGFPGVPATALPVYSANNAVYENPNSLWPRGALEHALLVGVYARDEVREERLRVRSPDLFDRHGDEVVHRLADQSENILPHVGVVIDNHSHLEKVALLEVVRLVQQIVAISPRT